MTFASIFVLAVLGLTQLPVAHVDVGRQRVEQVDGQFTGRQVGAGDQRALHAGGLPKALNPDSLGAKLEPAPTERCLASGVQGAKRWV